LGTAKTESTSFICHQISYLCRVFLIKSQLKTFVSELLIVFSSQIIVKNSLKTIAAKLKTYLSDSFVNICCACEVFCPLKLTANQLQTLSELQTDLLDVA
jgi:Na+-translocating ferredoxin:NAD+ oxidoreductase RnfC subunit